jgi:alanine racemase
MKIDRPAWAEISLGAFRRNLQNLRRLARPAEILPVIKADAYGHGMIPLSKVIQKEGLQTVAVALAQEGAALRSSGWRGQILLLEPTLPEFSTLLFKHRLTPQVSSISEAEGLDRVAGRLGVQKFPIQVEVDSGMGRVGFRPEDLYLALPRLARLKNLRVSGFYTHLATADWKESAYAKHQIALFHHVREEASVLLPQVPWHLANSAALLGEIPNAKGDWMRPGIVLYGIPPNPALARRIKLESVMTLKARVIMVKTVEPGESVGYNRTFKVKRETRVAVLAAGYADGILRSLSNKGKVLIHGQKVPMIGTVCMDMSMIDVTRVPNVKVGDTGVFFGHDGKATLSIDDQASAAGTISYELLCALGPRVERVYVS